MKLETLQKAKELAKLHCAKIPEVRAYQCAADHLIIYVCAKVTLPNEFGGVPVKMHVLPHFNPLT